MGDFFKEALTIKWWISVVLVGIILNLLSSYLYKWINQVKIKISVSSKQKNQREKDAQEKHLEFLRKNPNERYFVALQELRHRIQSLSFLFMGFLFMFLGQIFVEFFELDKLLRLIPMIISMSVGILCIFFSIISYKESMKKSILLKDSR